MLENTSFHGGKMSDYTWAMGMAATCNSFDNETERNVIQGLQKTILKDYEKRFQYNI